MQRMSAFCFFPLMTAITLIAPRVRAEPQATVGLTIGVARIGIGGQSEQSTAFHLGFRGDVLFGRNKGSDWGIGPYAEFLTNGFENIQFGSGVSGLIPLLDPYPLVVSLGTYAGKAGRPFGLEGGLAGEIFFGSRSYNFDAHYVMAAGMLAQVRYGLGPSRETAIVLGLQLDLVALSLPFVFLVNVMRGGSGGTDQVR